MAARGDAPGAALLAAAGAAFVGAALFVRQRQQIRSTTAPPKKDMPGKEEEGEKLYSDPNFPLNPDGSVHHVQVKPGQVANRVLSVGDHGRASRLAQFLDNVIEVPSSRGFRTFSGTYHGVPVSIIATGMGTAMIDFVVRETRAIVDGDMAFIRYGTCGGLADVAPGSVVVSAKGAVLVTRNADGIHGINGETMAYRISSVVLPDKELTAKFASELRERIPARYGVREGLNVTADSFYSSQGRTGLHFGDKNEGLLADLEARLQDVATLEMETYQLFELARSSRGTVRAAAATIPLSNRFSKATLTTDGLHELEMRGGEAALAALIAVPLRGVAPSA